MRSTKYMLIGIGIAMLMSSTPLFANTITATGTSTFDTGTGFGNVLAIMGLQPGGSTSTEWGFIEWVPPDNEGGDALAGAQTNTVTIAEVLAVGGSASSFTVIFNVNQQGGGTDFVTMTTFTLVFYEPDGDVIGQVTWDIVPDPLQDDFQFTVAGQGTGSSGYVFNVNLTTLAGVFGNPANRIGMFVPELNPIGNANDGPENFYIGPGLPVLTPEPSSLVLIGTGFLFFLFGCRHLRRAAQR